LKAPAGPCPTRRRMRLTPTSRWLVDWHRIAIRPPARPRWVYFVAVCPLCHVASKCPQLAAVQSQTISLVHLLLHNAFAADACAGTCLLLIRACMYVCTYVPCISLFFFCATPRCFQTVRTRSSSEPLGNLNRVHPTQSKLLSPLTQSSRNRRQRFDS
jgi:hypothetical protein